MQNEYEKLAKEYQKTDTKPDKLYSILPTVLLMAGDLIGKTVLDLGCGGGFFANAMAAAGAYRVIGIDNSHAQLKIACDNPQYNVSYQHGDIFKDQLPSCDIILAPFVGNYAEFSSDLTRFIESCYKTLKPGGKLITVFDMPSGKNLEKFGARKKVRSSFLRWALDKEEVWGKVEIELFNQGKSICTLYGTFLPKRQIVYSHCSAGFAKVFSMRPIVSDQGLELFSKEEWDLYLEDPELVYFLAIK